jgi:hypothetical protein
MHNKLFMLFLLLVSGLLFANENNFSLIYRGNLSGSSRTAVEKFLEKVSLEFPPLLKKSIGRKVYLKFKDFNKNKPLRPPLCPGDLENNDDQIFGEADRLTYVIYLNSHFLSEIIKGPKNSKQYACGFKNMYRFAESTAIHELAHLADNISNERSYRKVALWKRNKITHRTKPKNKLTSRSPEANENTNIREHFAVNVTHFLLDPKYSCHRPVLNEYFKARLQFVPISDCKLNTKIPISSFDLLGGDKYFDLDPNRIYEIHFMPALKGKNIESRWGHSMFRIVKCSPERELGPECRKDIEHHIVASFSAYIEGPNLNIWKGLTGGYPSLVFLTPLREVIEKYTERELREIQSFPLKLTAEQKRIFILRLLEQYWEYQSSYYFFSNNCNTESIDLIKTLFNTSMKGISPLTPKSTVEKLAYLNLLDADVLANRQEARKNSLLFLSGEEALQKAFFNLKDYLKKTNTEKAQIKTLWTYIKKSTANERREFFSMLKKAPQATLAALAYLESYIESDRQYAFKNSQAAKLSAHIKNNLINSDLKKELTDIVIKQPARKALGYGIPLETELEKNQNLSLKATTALKEWRRKNFQAELAELELINQNIRFLEASILKTLN